MQPSGTVGWTTSNPKPDAPPAQRSRGITHPRPGRPHAPDTAPYRTAGRHRAGHGTPEPRAGDAAVAAMRRCPGNTRPDGTPGPCPHLIPPGTRYCPTHARAYEQRRGTTTQRGYGYTHRRQAEGYRARVRDGETIICWRCRQPITDPNDLDLGHDDQDRSIVRGPEHARGCNRSAAGRAGRAAQG